MRVRQGWSGEVEPNRWAKFDLELEEDDLRRVLQQHDLVGVDPPLATCFQILELEAERLVMVKLMTRYGYPEVAGRDRLNKINSQLQAVMLALADKYQRVPA